MIPLKSRQIFLDWQLYSLLRAIVSKSLVEDKVARGQLWPVCLVLLDSLGDLAIKQPAKCSKLLPIPCRTGYGL